MKSIVILLDEGSSYSKKLVFGGRSALELSLDWAGRNGDCVKVLKLSEIENISDLLEKMKAAAGIEKADYVLFSYADLPFLNDELTEELKKTHLEYQAEYTFADGYPYGFAPELIDSGTLSILCELSKTVQAGIGQKAVSRTSIYELLKTDINSFEIETVLSPTDWRLLRLQLCCGKKLDFLAAKKLYEVISEKNQKLNCEEISEIASKTCEVLKTVPSFYEIQLSEGLGKDSLTGTEIYCPYKNELNKKLSENPDFSFKAMSEKNFYSLLDSIAELSENAVLSFSAWGEPLLHPHLLEFIERTLNFPGLSVFIETDGQNITEDFCAKLSEIEKRAAVRTNGYDKIMISVKLDALSAQTYAAVHPGVEVSFEEAFQKALLAVQRLNAVLPGAVYPQFTRMQCNEAELESFFRFWNEKTSPSSGNVLIQKFNSFGGLLPDYRPADLSPLERDVCWHLRRDMTILSNGDVPFCHSCVLGNKTGNVFEEGLETVWHKSDNLIQEQLDKKYNQLCRKCDEYYTFNF